MKAKGSRGVSGWVRMLLLLFFLWLAPQAAWGQERLADGSLDLTIEEVDGPPEFVTNIDFPFQRLEVTNNAAESVTVTFTAELSGYETNPPFPQPGALYLGPGESNQVYTFLDQLYGDLDLYNANAVTRDWTYTFIDFETRDQISYASTWRLTTWDQASAPQVGQILGRTVDEQGLPVSGASVSLYSTQTTGGPPFSTSTTSSANGTFSLALPAVRDHFFVEAKSPGHLTAFTPLDPEALSEVTLTLPRGDPGSPRLTTLKSLEDPIGFWRGVVSADGAKFLVVQGVEHWIDESLKNQSQLRLYSSQGELVWAVDMGWQAWGADLSADGRWAVYATLSQGPGEPNHFALVDAASGAEVWRRSTEELPSFSQCALPDFKCREIVLNRAADMIAVGTDGGGIYFLDRASGQVTASAFLGGMVRRIIFRADDSVAYASSGDGHLYALDPRSGEVLWRSFAESWAYTRGLALSPDEEYLGLAAKTGFGVLLRTVDGARVFEKFMGRLNAACVAFHPSGEGVFFGSGFRGAYFDLSGQVRWYTEQASAAAFSPQGDFLVLGPDQEQGLRVLHAASGTTIDGALDRPFFTYSLTMCRLGDQGGRVFTAGEDGRLGVYQADW